MARLGAVGVEENPMFWHWLDVLSRFNFKNENNDMNALTKLTLAMYHWSKRVFASFFYLK